MEYLQERTSDAFYRITRESVMAVQIPVRECFLGAASFWNSRNRSSMGRQTSNIVSVYSIKA